eukprot:CAMPEP_0170521690 /NCGR_PEP_ID=MMETSP0209-20121228/7052_1 /TAXON_ID=665100 ORGANISM="Litonotus pictus, Strain P1" /NCGR_SAMPLE_ID=MMETSP0209 /ASSEMBLY_ACC=CAM_ASM_000301 /LENGTH=650 /DNA_ID=CAMNT_0010808697 /DNA_START=175 /DNA_END=2127 /DNA_ORIENTATION=-
MSVLGNQIYITIKNTQYSTFLADNKGIQLRDLYKAILLEPQFKEIYREINEMENLFQEDFASLDHTKQIEVLIKAYFFYQTETGNLRSTLSNLQEKLKLLESQEEERYSSLIEKYKNEAYSYKCERDDLKIKSNSVRAKLDRLTTDNEKLQAKLTRMKEKQKQFEIKIERFTADKREVENKYKKAMSENSLLQEMYEKSIQDSAEKESLVRRELKEREQEGFTLKDHLKALEVKCRELKERNEQLEIICKSTNIMKGTNNNDSLLEELGINQGSANEKRKKSEGSSNTVSVGNRKEKEKEHETGFDKKTLDNLLDNSGIGVNTSNIGRLTKQGGLVLDAIFTSVEDCKPTVTPSKNNPSEYTVSMKINLKSVTKKTSFTNIANLYGSTNNTNNLPNNNLGKPNSLINNSSNYNNTNLILPSPINAGSTNINYGNYLNSNNASIHLSNNPEISSLTTDSARKNNRVVNFLPSNSNIVYVSKGQPDKADKADKASKTEESIHYEQTEEKDRSEMYMISETNYNLTNITNKVGTNSSFLRPSLIIDDRVIKEIEEELQKQAEAKRPSDFNIPELNHIKNTNTNTNPNMLISNFVSEFDCESENENFDSRIMKLNTSSKQGEETFTTVSQFETTTQNNTNNRVLHEQYGSDIKY